MSTYNNNNNNNPVCDGECNADEMTVAAIGKAGSGGSPTDTMSFYEHALMSARQAETLRRIAAEAATSNTNMPTHTTTNPTLRTWDGRDPSLPAPTGSEAAASRETDSSSSWCWSGHRKGALLFIGLAALTVAIGALVGLGFATGQIDLSDDGDRDDNNDDGDDPTDSTDPTDPTHPPTFFFPDVPTNLTVGVYYYPWHGDDFHRGGAYLRRELNQKPTLGEYDDRRVDVIAQHLAWSRQANVRLWVSSWWGPDRREDETLLYHIMEHPNMKQKMMKRKVVQVVANENSANTAASSTSTTVRKKVIYEETDDLYHQVALFYEARGRIERFESTHNVEPDMRYICQHYFSHPNYFRVHGERPLLVIYLTRVLEPMGLLEETVKIMRSVSETYGYNIYIVGDHAFQKPPKPSDMPYAPFDYLDAITNYDAHNSVTQKGSFYALQDGVDHYFEYQQQWKQLAADQSGCNFIPSVLPGFNDRPLFREGDKLPLSRKLNGPNDPEGSLFRELLRQTRYLVDDAVRNLLLVVSFNEWHEDTQIEPAIGEATTEPFLFTKGVEYTGYGDLYLNILRNMTIDDGDEFFPGNQQEIDATTGIMAVLARSSTTSSSTTNLTNP